MVPTDPNNPMSDPTRDEVLSTLAFERSTTSLFLGSPFTGLNSATPSDGHFQPVPGPAAMVSRISFTTDANVPALKVTLKDHATIKLSDSTIGGSQFSNFLTVRSGSGFQFDEIDYSVDERALWNGRSRRQAAQTLRLTRSGRNWPKHRIFRTIGTISRKESDCCWGRISPTKADNSVRLRNSGYEHVYMLACPRFDIVLSCPIQFEPGHAARRRNTISRGDYALD